MFWTNLTKVIILILGITVVAFDAELYIAFKQQRNEMNTMSDQQKIETQVNSNKFKYMGDQIDRLSRDLDDAQQRIKDQGDALAEQKEDNKSIQTSLVDIKAETDAIKEDMKGWQRDYVGVLAELGKGVENIQVQIKGLRDSVNSLSIVPPVTENNEVNAVKEKDEDPL